MQIQQIYTMISRSGKIVTINQYYSHTRKYGVVSLIPQENSQTINSQEELNLWTEDLFKYNLLLGVFNKPLKEVNLLDKLLKKEYNISKTFRI